MNEINVSKQYSPNSCGLQSADGGRTAFRAVVFAGGCAPEPEQTERFFEFFGTPDCIVAADSGLRTCAAYADFFSGRCALSPEAVLGDFDSLPAEELAAARTSDAAFKAFPCDKDDTDTELAVQYAYSRASDCGCASPHIAVVGGDGGRIDHLLNIYDSFAAPQHPSVWLCREQGVWLLEAGCTAAVRNLAASDVVSVARTSAGRRGGTAASRGLRWEAAVFRESGMPSISNRIAPDFLSRGEPVELRAEGADFLLVLPLHAVAEIRRAP